MKPTSILLAAALAALAGCSGEAEYEIIGSLDGSSFAVTGPARGGSAPAGEVVPETSEPDPLAAQATRAGDASAVEDEDPGEQPWTMSGPGGQPAEHGVKTEVPDNLPEGVRFLTFPDVTWLEYEPLDLRDVSDDAYTAEDFPENLQELDGERIAFDGYMVPVDFEERKVTSFILSRYLPGCCFGVMPRMDEWIEVDVLIEGGVEYYPYQIIRVIGDFEIGEVLDDYGYVRSIYRISAETVDENL